MHLNIAKNTTPSPQVLSTREEEDVRIFEEAAEDLLFYNEEDLLEEHEEGVELLEKTRKLSAEELMKTANSPCSASTSTERTLIMTTRMMT